MNNDETTVLLRIRRDLTGESFNDGTVGAWSEALRIWPFAAVRAALVDGSRQHQRVTVAHVVERLPDRHREAPAPPAYCELCDGCGWVSAPPERAHNPRHCRPTAERPCMCTASEPCQCSAAKDRDAEGVRRRIVEHSDRHRTNHGQQPPPATTHEPGRLDLL